MLECRAGLVGNNTNTSPMAQKLRTRDIREEREGQGHGHAHAHGQGQKCRHNKREGTNMGRRRKEKGEGLLTSLWSVPFFFINVGLESQTQCE